MNRPMYVLYAGVNVYTLFLVMHLCKVLILNGNRCLFPRKEVICYKFKTTFIHTDNMLAIKTWWNSIFACEIKLHLNCYQSRSSLRKFLFSDLQAKSKEEWKSAESIYDFSVKDIDGNEVSLEKYRYLKFVLGFFFKSENVQCMKVLHCSSCVPVCIMHYALTDFVKCLAAAC